MKYVIDLINTPISIRVLEYSETKYTKFFGDMIHTKYVKRIDYKSKSYLVKNDTSSLSFIIGSIKEISNAVP